LLLLYNFFITGDIEYVVRWSVPLATITLIAYGVRKYMVLPRLMQKYVLWRAKVRNSILEYVFSRETLFNTFLRIHCVLVINLRSFMARANNISPVILIPGVMLLIPFIVKYDLEYIWFGFFAALLRLEFSFQVIIYFLTT